MERKDKNTRQIDNDMKTETPVPAETQAQAPKTNMAAALEAAGIAGQETGTPAPVLQKIVVVETPTLPQPPPAEEMVKALGEADAPPGLVDALAAGLRRLEATAPPLPPVPAAIPTKPKSKVRMVMSALAGNWMKILVYSTALAAFAAGAMAAIWVFIAVVGGEEHKTDVQLHQGLSEGGIWSDWRFKSDSEKMTHITTSGRGDIKDITTTSRGEDYKLGPKGWVKK